MVDARGLRGAGRHARSVIGELQASEHRAVAVDRERRRAAARSSAAISRPAAQVPPSRMHASGSCSALRPSRVAHQRRQLVEQRDRQRAPLDDQLVADGVQRARAVARRRAARCTPASSSRPPLRYSGRPVSASSPVTRDAGPLERLEQRVGEPLRQLVERHPAGGRCRRRRRARMRARRRRAARRRAAAARPDRRRGRRAAPRRIARRAATRRSRAVGGQRVEQRAGPRRRRRTRRGCARSAAPSRRSSAARPSRPTSGLSSRDLEHLAPASRASSARSAAASTRSGSPASRRERARP